MSLLPLEIADEIISVVAQNDPSFSSTKACALVCHDFHHLCRKHLFASIILRNTRAHFPLANAGTTEATTHMLQRLLDTFPEVAHHIRSLNYSITSEDLGNSSLVETFKKITRLTSFAVWHFGLPRFQWNNNSLRPALLHLLHLPTLINLSVLVMENFLVSDLAPCTNLEQLKLVHLTAFDEPLASNLPEKSLRLRSISVGSKCAGVTTKMYAMRCADGKPFIDFSGVNHLEIRMHTPNDVQESFNLVKRCTRLTSIDVDLPIMDSVENLSLTGLSKMLYPSMQTLTHLCLKSVFHEDTGSVEPLAGLGEELMEMKNNNVIESITIKVTIEADSDCTRGEEWGRLDTLAQPGWPKLQRVSLAILVWSSERPDDELERALKKLPQTQFPKLTSSKSLSFEFSVRGEYIGPT